LIGVPGGSGGYLETIFRYASKQLFGQDVENLTFKTKRNVDFKEVTLEVSSIENFEKKKFSSLHIMS
jgi:hypothetical protein